MHATVTRDVARTLDDAAVYLDQHGWCREHIYEHRIDRLPVACTLGAIYLVTFGRPVESAEFPGVHPVPAAQCRAAIAYLADYLNEYGDWPFDLSAREIVADWNDHRVHTATEAIATLHAAAAHYRHTQARAAS